IQLRTAAALAAAQAEETKASATMKAAAADKQAAAAASVLAEAQMVSARPGSVVGNIVNGGRVTIPRDQMPNRFNTANIAAQFQDIGVTAAMGMNPLQIALQQGTQLVAILNQMEKPAQGLVQAFQQIFNKVSLIGIGLVALVAAGLEAINWIKVAQGLL